MTVLHHIGGGLAAMILFAEMQERRSRAGAWLGIGDDDVAHRLGMGGNFVPHAERLEHAAGGGGDGRGAAVETVASEFAWISLVEDENVERAQRLWPRQSHRRGESVQGGSGNQDVRFIHGGERPVVAWI